MFYLIRLKSYDLQPNEVEHLINGLIDDKFINNTRYAQSYTRGSYRHKKWGWNKIKVNLLSKKIDNESIQLAYKEIDQEEYLQMITSELVKKWPMIKGKSEFDKTNK